MVIDKMTLAAARKYTNKVVEGLGAIKGSNTTIKYTTEIDEGTIITFEWVGTSGTTETTDILVKNGIDGKDGLNGVSVQDANINDNGELILTLDNGQELNAGTVTSVKGDKGDSAYATVEKVNDVTTITFTDVNGTTTAEIKDGLDGKDGISPTVISKKGDGITTVEITDMNGTQSIEIKDGIDGKSPIIELERTDSNDGVDITVTNADGTTSTQTIYDGSGDDVIEISKEEYEKLSDEEKKDKIFYIYDDEDGTLTWNSLLDKPFETIDEDTLSVENGKLKVGGSSIKSISINGENVEPDENKNVDIDLSNYQTELDVDEKITTKLNEKVLKTTNFIEQKTDIFSCDSSNGVEPIIEYTECYLDTKTGILHMDITIVFDSATSFTSRTLTILDEECYIDENAINTSLLKFYEAESNTLWGTINGTTTTAQLKFGGNSSSALSFRIVGAYPTTSILTTPTIQDQINDSNEQLNNCVNKVELTSDGVNIGTVNGGESLVVPIAKTSQLGVVHTTSTVTSTSGLTACPIISGTPYYKNPIKVFSATYTLDDSNYYTDDSNVFISIPNFGATFNSSTVFNIYIYHSYTMTAKDGSGPQATAFITAIPNTLAYPDSSSIVMVNSTWTSSGAAVPKGTVIAKQSNGSLLITFTNPTDSWQKYMSIKVVAV
ncbi:MAG: hypothetical protein IJA10_10425 [Lachnospiraceae bacterium]|nr:hypothetical protein [Lachnospiraceae bacterium]